MFDMEKAQQSVLKWKSHIVRAVQQEQAKAQVLENLRHDQCLVTCDWAMKFLPMRIRETQELWFGKKGKSWHVAAVITKNSDGDLEVMLP